MNTSDFFMLKVISSIFNFSEGNSNEIFWKNVNNIFCKLIAYHNEINEEVWNKKIMKNRVLAMKQSVWTDPCLKLNFL